MKRNRWASNEGRSPINFCRKCGNYSPDIADICKKCKIIEEVENSVEIRRLANEMAHPLRYNFDYQSISRRFIQIEPIERIDEEEEDGQE